MYKLLIILYYPLYMGFSIHIVDFLLKKSGAFIPRIQLFILLLHCITRKNNLLMIYRLYPYRSMVLKSTIGIQVAASQFLETMHACFQILNGILYSIRLRAIVSSRTDLLFTTNHIKINFWSIQGVRTKFCTAES